MYTMKELTEKQIQILDYISNYELVKGYWPSIRDIQHKFNFKSTNAVTGHLKSLEKKGAIQRIPGQARTFKIQHKESNNKNILDTLEIPIYGSIAAGFPDRVEPSGIIDKLRIDAKTYSFSQERKSFALEVFGDSMIDAEIYEGDRIIIENIQPKDGDIVAALIDGEVTLKRLIKKPNEMPYLKAENKNYPALFPVNDLEIQGVAKAVVRQL